MKLNCSLITPSAIDYQDLSARRKLQEKKVEREIEDCDATEREAEKEQER